MANIYRFSKQANPAAYRVLSDGTFPISMGDLVWFDTSAFCLKRLISAGDGQNFVGVAEGVGPTPTSNIDHVAGLVGEVKVRSNGIFTITKTTADSLVHGDALVGTADPQVVLKRVAEDVADIIGYVWAPEASAAQTGAGEVEVLIRSNFPAAGILI